MKIDLKQFNNSGVERVPFSETISLKEEKMYGAYPFQAPVQLTGAIENRLGVLRLTGTIKTIYSTSCARCLKPLEILLTAQTDTILSDRDSDEDEDDLYVVTGDEVDPADIMVPALILQVEMTYLCSDDCKGLCPYCGADRNVTDCGCEGKQTDPRFDALRALLDEKE